MNSEGFDCSLKKATVSAILISFLLMCSCAVQTAPEKICVNRIFSAKMTLHYNGTAYTADFTCDENGCSAVFLSPEEINSLTFATDGNTVTYSIDGLEFKSEINRDLPLNAIYNAITSPAENAQKNEGGYTLYSSTEHGRYIMNINNNYIPEYIEFNDEEFTVKFDSIT